MFVKKDLRKVPQILSDAASRAKKSSTTSSDPSDPSLEDSSSEKPVTELSFARRAPEFIPAGQTVALILEPQFRPALDHLVQLSLYDCGLMSLAGVESKAPIAGAGVGVGIGVGNNELSNLSTNDANDANVFPSMGEADHHPAQHPLFPNLQQLDIGRNPKLTNDSLPSTFHTQFPSLRELWCDDCSFGPTIPMTFLHLSHLEVVRLTGNSLEGMLEEGIGLGSNSIQHIQNGVSGVSGVEVDDGGAIVYSGLEEVGYWREVRVLALDGNQLTGIGRGIGRLKNLEKLHLRQNKLTTLPENVPGPNNSKLSMISLSSNQLTSIPSTIVDVGPSLKEIYLNSNHIEKLPSGLGEKLTGLNKLNLAHNWIGKTTTTSNDGQTNANENNGNGGTNEISMEIENEVNDEKYLPHDFVQRFGMPDARTGECTNDENCVVRLEGNPLAEERKKKWLAEEKRKAKEMKEMAMEVDQDVEQ